MTTTHLPIEAVLPSVRRALATAPNALLTAPPGSGKTTIVPLALLNEPWLAGQRMVLLEPRRLAARAAAQRMAALLGEAVGERVGYQIRFERKFSAATRIEVVTEGILTRRLQQDPELTGVGLLLFDEFHERSLHADLALALALEVQQALRPELRIMAMSATLEQEPLRRLLGQAEVIVGEGVCYPVTIRLAEREPQGSIAAVAAAGVERALAEELGDILCFLPGTREIHQVAALLQPLAGQLDIHPLYGDLTREQQQRALLYQPGGQRRVVLATSIAETSLTIEGITIVVDSGWSRRPRFHPNHGLTHLETVRVSQAAATQRAGRAGRLAAGFCYRLWSAATERQLTASHPPEILDCDPAPLALELARWGCQDPATLRWLDPPPAGHYAQAQELLQRLGALDRQLRITTTGRQMAELGLHPRLARMLLAAAQWGQGEEACALAALLSERSPLRRRSGEALPVDLELHLELLQRFRSEGAAAVRDLAGDLAACRQLDQVARHWQRQLPAATAPRSPQPYAVLLALAYPDRIAQRCGTGRFRLSSGRRATLSLGDPLAASDYLVVAHLDAGHREGRIYLAARITLEQLRATLGEQITHHQTIVWEEASEAVVAARDECLGALRLQRRPHPAPDPEQLAAVLLEGIRRLGLAALPWNPTSRALQQRVCCLREWQPHANWPDLSDAALLATLEQWLLAWLGKSSRRSHLERLDLHAILYATLDWSQQQALEQLAPTHLRLPGGQRRPLRYQVGSPPVLAVRLQELFGVKQTPTLCAGQVTVTLHLLSPAQRPIQITQDLESFWRTTYPEVKKELKGRYPKHRWPEDPYR